MEPTTDFSAIFSKVQREGFPAMSAAKQPWKALARAAPQGADVPGTAIVTRGIMMYGVGANLK
ncbi:hypothetical protein K4F52_003002 [Lecanicillium sp. MT-2017a]|nr:hypothetical protein K4F52_003002 [Lecanicillium sp. MT-2017a]